MTSLERVRAAIHFGTPDRLPFTGAVMTTDFTGDTVSVFVETPFKYWLGGGGTDEWGCRWEVDPAHPNMGQVKGRVLEDLARFADVARPDASDPARYDHLEPILDRADREQRYVVMCNGSLVFERMHFLYGFEPTLVAVMAEPDRARAFARHIAGYHIDTIRYLNRRFPGRIHGYRGTDDWGTQLAPIASPHAFADVFQPVYAEIFDACHQAGMDAWMHSCGQIVPLVDHLIDAGLDVLQASQPSLYPMTAMKPFAGRLAFEMFGDLQTTAIVGDPDAIRDEVRQIIDATCTSRGGLVVMPLDEAAVAANELDPAVAARYDRLFRQCDPFIKEGL